MRLTARPLLALIRNQPLIHKRDIGAAVVSIVVTHVQASFSTEVEDFLTKLQAVVNELIDHCAAKAQEIFTGLADGIDAVVAGKLFDPTKNEQEAAEYRQLMKQSGWLSTDQVKGAWGYLSESLVAKGKRNANSVGITAAGLVPEEYVAPIRSIAVSLRTLAPVVVAKINELKRTTGLAKASPVVPDSVDSTLPPEVPKVLGNLLKEYAGTHFEYDSRGNLIGKRSPSGRQQYEWDGFNRLRIARVEESERRHEARYFYDPFGRRIGKDVDGVRTVFGWDGDQLAYESSDGGATQYVYEPESFVPLAQYVTAQPVVGIQTPMWSDGEPYVPEQDPLQRVPEMQSDAHLFYYHCDQIGTPLLMTDEVGEVVWEASYRAWGEAREVIARVSLRAGIAPRNPIRFQGQQEDAETGLRYNRNRDYDPSVGRFVSKDPIGLDGGINVYQYASNPVEWIDLSKIRDYGVIWSDILVPLVSEAVRVAIEELVNDDDVQFIPADIRASGEAIDGSYFLLNPTRKVDVVDHDASEPMVVKVSGFPDAKVGFKKMVLRPEFPANGIGRQYDSPTYIIVGDQLADAVLRATKKGVRFTTGIPPAG